LDQAGICLKRRIRVIRASPLIIREDHQTSDGLRIKRSAAKLRRRLGGFTEFVIPIRKNDTYTTACYIITSAASPVASIA
jgi:hypothetical protein